MVECGLCSTSKSKVKGWSNSVSPADLYCSFLAPFVERMKIKVPFKRLLIVISAQLANSSQLTKEQYQIRAMTIHIHGQSGLIITVYPRGSQSVFSAAISQWV